MRRVYNEMDLRGEVCTKRRMLSMIWWEIECFHLTIGDGCRKLGGHAREMILLVNVEFEEELQGCKKTMSRDLTSLVTHENSGGASHSATADVDVRRVASSTIVLSQV